MLSEWQRGMLRHLVSRLFDDWHMHFSTGRMPDGRMQSHERSHLDHISLCGQEELNVALPHRLFVPA